MSKSNSYNKAIRYKSILFWVAFINICYLGQSFAQDYRNPKAYIRDFGKNELYVKESLMEYSTSIIDASPDTRIQVTLERIYKKLEDLEVNLLTNDKGINGDTGLRDAFLTLNTKTITLLKNKSLKLNDYQVQSALDYGDIFKNFSYKEMEISDYYKAILAYENSKRDFGLKFNIIIRFFNKKNVFEYDAYQNLIFYKLNVLDDKLIELMKAKDLAAVNKCIDYINQIGKESLLKTDQLKGDYTDTSLNDANIELITFFIKQNETLLPLYQDYVVSFESFQKKKAQFVESNDAVAVEEYNSEVRKYNKAKNTYFDALYEIQLKKRDLVNRWYITNSDFLRHNIEFENLYEKFTSED
ncbi:hypothetical protein OX284_009980 [Flavobacterium sp. SUN046]|uniref:hypothetical protein n=1 Tax=Flavobacterium sp. SUN046 TaxID=3002440 RepID=UPI002DBAD885|nr:hypothetical protein [Flavobacterium sp. SUN046]MEC4049755.1 hypothetical protein [Flavobacterium sp. SUN046]